MKQYWYAETKTQSGRVTCGHKHRSVEAAHTCLGKQPTYNGWHNGYIKSNLDR